MRYLLDTNCFLEAKNWYYQFSFHPAFWDALASGRLNACSIDKVRDEIYEKEDELSDFITKKLIHIDGFFLNSTTYFNEYRDVLNEAQQMLISNGVDKGTIERRMSNFGKTEEADPWLIACAKSENLVLITFEKYSTKSSEIKIPTLCDRLGVQHKTLFDVIKASGVKFETYL